MSQLSPESPVEKSKDVKVYHSPNTILNIYAQYLKSQIDNRLLLVKGVYISVPNANLYGGYYYENLKGENDTTSLKIKVPALIRSKLQSKQIYVLSGFIEKKVAASAIELVFSVDSVLTSEKGSYTEGELEGFKLLQQKVAKGYIDVEAKIRERIYENRKVRIANIYGVTSEVDVDFDLGIAASRVNFEITNFRCSLIQPQQIVDTLKKIATGNYDLIAIVRGGNDPSIEVLNDPIISRQILSLNSVFVSALGHQFTTETLLDKIADKKFGLPNDYGVKLREIVERATEDLTNSKSALLKKVRAEVAKSFEDSYKLLNEQLKNATASNLEKDKYYTKLIEDRVSRIYRENQEGVSKLKQEQKTSQIIALVIGFAIAMLIFYTLKQ